MTNDSVEVIEKQCLLVKKIVQIFIRFHGLESEISYFCVLFHQKLVNLSANYNNGKMNLMNKWGIIMILLIDQIQRRLVVTFVRFNEFFVAINLLFNLIFCIGGQDKSQCLNFHYVRVRLLTGEKW